MKEIIMNDNILYMVFHKKTVSYLVIFCMFAVFYWIISRTFSGYFPTILPSVDSVESMSIIDGFSKQPVIPLHIYQTWGTNDLPDKMKRCVDKLKRKNPDFEHHLFDDVKCREFIQTYFEDEVVEAYDRIVPGAYRADLWRYCVLYINGGIYLDIKYSNVNGFNLISLTDREYFCRDIEKSGSGIYNAFMICKPKNEKLLKCINQIVENVKNNYYGESCLSPTGPLLMKLQFTEYELSEISANGLGLCQDKCPTETCICKDGNPILAIYKEYYEKDAKDKRYCDLWNDRAIYK